MAVKPNRVLGFLCKRAGERSTYAHLVMTLAVAVVAPWPWNLMLGGLSLIGAAMPDGSLKRR
jgi:hypothetical protein